MIEDDWLEVLCNRCKCARFKVVKPQQELAKDHCYFSCPDCVRKKNREFDPKYNLYMKFGVLPQEKVEKE